MKSCFLLLLVILSGCASQQKKEQDELRLHFSKKNYKGALKSLEKSELKKDKESRLIYLAEKGRLYLAQDKNLKASAIFEEAIKLSDQLYNKSLSSSLKSNLSKRYEEYFGEYYERSMLYYFQTLSYLKVAQETSDEKEKRLWMVRARATLLLWDSTLQGMRKSEDYDSLFVQDLWNRIFAGIVHEHIGEREDLGIALQLYKDAKDALGKVALTYSAFNSKYDKLALEIRKSIASKTLDKLDWKNFIKETEELKSLQAFLDKRMLEILKKKKMVIWQECQRLGLARDVCKMSPPEENNVTILIEEGLISSKKAVEVAYNLRTAIDSMEDGGTKTFVRAIGVPVLTLFALGTLGLGYYSGDENSSVYVYHDAGTSLVEEVGIEFEVTDMDPPAPIKNYHLMIKDKKKDKEVETPLVVAASLSDLGHQALVEKNSKEGLKNGARIAVKYIAAIVAAYQAYKAVKGSSDDAGMEFFAKAAALAAYVGATKAIKASESADLRHWTTLPSDFRVATFNLEPGEYELKLESEPDKKGQKSKSTLSSIKVEPGKRYIFPYIFPSN